MFSNSIAEFNNLSIIQNREGLVSMKINKASYQPNFGMVQAEIRNSGQKDFLNICQVFSNRFRGRRDVDLLTAQPKTSENFLLALQCAKRGFSTDSRQEAVIIKTIREWAQKHGLGGVTFKR